VSAHGALLDVVHDDALAGDEAAQVAASILMIGRRKVSDHQAKVTTQDPVWLALDPRWMPLCARLTSAMRALLSS
jgi:hypothetical protein